MMKLRQNPVREARRGGASPSPLILTRGGETSRRAVPVSVVSAFYTNTGSLQTETILQVSNKIGAVESIDVTPSAEVPVQVWPFPSLGKRGSIEERGCLELKHVLIAVSSSTRGFFSNTEEHNPGLAPRLAVSALLSFFLGVSHV